MTSRNARRGQSLAELLIAVAIGAVMILSAVTIIAPALKSSGQVTASQTAGAGARELMDTVRAWSEDDWHGIYNLSKSSSSPYFFTMSSSGPVVATGTEFVATDGITSGLIGAWRFEEATGSVALDYSGNNSTGSWQGGGTHYASGTFNSYAGQFNGTNDYIRLTSSTSSVLKQSFTGLSVSAWIYLTATTGSGSNTGPGLISNTNGNGWGFHINNGYPFVLFYYPPGGFGNLYSSQIGSTRPALNKWEHITFVFDGSTHTVAAYLNGAQVGSVTAPSAATSIMAAPASACTLIGAEPDLFGGCNSDGGEGVFPGRIDDLRVYSRALSQAEIQKIYKGGAYTRYFYVENVSRDPSGFISPSGSVDDPSTQKITTVYRWPQLSTPKVFVEYLTRYRSRIAAQNNWAAGAVATTTDLNFRSDFATSTNIDYATSTGSVVIQGF